MTDPVQPLTPLQQAQAMVSAYLAAEQAILLGKRVRIGGSGIDRELTHEDLSMVQAGRRDWETRVARLSASATVTPGAAPRSFGGLSFGVSNFSETY